jgi:hypothetical protein
MQVICVNSYEVKSRYGTNRRPRLFSREAAQESSPWRKPWVKPENNAALKGRKKQPQRVAHEPILTFFMYDEIAFCKPTFAAQRN